MKYNGRVFEAITARVQRRPALDLYHAALAVTHHGDRWVIEMAPAWGADGAARGAVVEGPVGARWAGRSRMFRYEIRRWRNGVIPDIAEAVNSPQRLTADATAARMLLDSVPEVPARTWGRDELGAGDMWNSNSVVAWLLVRSGIDANAAQLPAGGRAPGWDAGLIAAGA